ncbi:hypothetical protein BDR03DRAFT_1019672 [Suillus americanus]|nr:hypothetical protein BDR03DRAFT_1019672 [Suillus americanus]
MPVVEAESGDQDTTNPHANQRFRAVLKSLNDTSLGGRKQKRTEGVLVEFDPDQESGSNAQEVRAYLVQVYKKFASTIPGFSELNTKFEADPDAWTGFRKVRWRIHSNLASDTEDDMGDFFGNDSGGTSGQSDGTGTAGVGSAGRESANRESENRNSIGEHEPCEREDNDNDEPEQQPRRKLGRDDAPHPPSSPLVGERSPLTPPPMSPPRPESIVCQPPPSRGAVVVMVAVVVATNVANLDSLPFEYHLMRLFLAHMSLEVILSVTVFFVSLL